MVAIGEVLPHFRDPGAFCSLLDQDRIHSIRIHAGFGHAYATVYQRIRVEAMELMHERIRPLYISGHSPGGALATQCSLDVLSIASAEGMVVTTFGSPMVGNQQFADAYDLSIERHCQWRVVLASDIITKVPNLINGKFAHVGSEVCVKRFRLPFWLWLHASGTSSYTYGLVSMIGSI